MLNGDQNVKMSKQLKLTVATLIALNYQFLKCKP
jgi:hypothetical protein